MFVICQNCDVIVAILETVIDEYGEEKEEHDRFYEEGELRASDIDDTELAAEGWVSDSLCSACLVRTF